jgi:hypothetical protein
MSEARRQAPDAATRAETPQVEVEWRPWVLIERYVESYPDDFRLVFRRIRNVEADSDPQVLEVSVPEEVWRAFDAA